MKNEEVTLRLNELEGDCDIENLTFSFYIFNFSLFISLEGPDLFNFLFKIFHSSFPRRPSPKSILLFGGQKVIFYPRI